MKKNEISALIALFFFIKSNVCFSQIGAEAQGGKLTMWTAIGLDQKISEKWFSVTDLGYGRHSDPDNYKFTKRQGLNVITQDFVYKPDPHWNFSFSLGYWRRNFYSDEKPYDQRLFPYQFRNEIRPYQRIIYNQTLKKIRISHTFRTDYRFYYDQDLKTTWTTPFEFRARYTEKWKFPLTAKQNDWFILIDEVLTAVDRTAVKTWSPYQFTENRLSCYYRHSFFNKKVDFDLGIMHQYWREKPGVSNFNVSYNLMMDIIIRDPFGEKKKKS